MFNQIHQLYISADTPVLEAMRIISNGGAQIALVVDQQHRLKGTLTDGDIRRGMLSGKGLDAKAGALMNRQFISVNNRVNREKLLEIMQRDILHQVPILDDQGKVVKLMLLQELFQPEELSNHVVIMAGGKGTRLRPQTENCPKPMLKVDGKPMLEILLENCIDNGFRHFYLSVNYLKEQIIEHFQDGARWGVSIKYLMEEKPMGTAGSLQLLPDSVTEPFLVLNGDVFTKFNPSHLLNFHIKHKAQATLCVREHAITVPFGVVQINGIELAGFTEKPTYKHLVNAGIYLIDPCLLHLVPHNQFTDMPTLLNQAQQANNKVIACPIHEYWLDVGRPETLQQAHKEWPSEMGS